MSSLPPEELDPHLQEQLERYQLFKPYESTLPLGAFLNEQFWSPSLFGKIFVTELMIMKERSSVQHEYLGVKVVALDNSDQVMDSASARIDRGIDKASKVKGYRLGDVDENAATPSPSSPTDVASTPSILLSSPPISQDAAPVAQGNLVASSSSSSSSLLPSWDEAIAFSHRCLSTGPARDTIGCSHKSVIPSSETSVVLSTMSFSGRAFPFDELVVLAHSVSKAAPDYNVSSTMCYWHMKTTWDLVVTEKEGCIDSTTITEGVSRWVQQGIPHGFSLVSTGVLLPSQEPPALRIAYKKDWEIYKEKMLEAKKKVNEERRHPAYVSEMTKMKEDNQAIVEAGQKSRVPVAVEQEANQERRHPAYVSEMTKMEEEDSQAIVEAGKKTRRPSRGIVAVELEVSKQLEGVHEASEDVSQRLPLTLEQTMSEERALLTTEWEKKIKALEEQVADLKSKACAEPTSQ